ncbi:DNA-binding protein [Maritimibacter dapengensis]|uniref:DNA-binding protein n=1 Tax=Maritimibacter dapengensis TaxID=2836868 RepID=A0ABS6T7B2_9RHOB|nr:DNA-binding protein [Maritimibacter dapengensis]MBV7380583.1 DNA-binding protein [Maritimibacter dapengensis]
MSKHDPKLAKSAETKAEFEKRVEDAFLDFVKKNQGKMPTNTKLNEKVGTSMSRLTPLTRMLKEKHSARETKLSAMTAVPDEIREAYDRLLEDLWMKTRDMQNAELVDMKKTLETLRQEHRVEIDDFESIVSDLEAKLDGANRQVSEADSKIAELDDLVADLTAKLADAEARLSERQAFFDELKASLISVTPGPKAPSKKGSSKKTQDEEPETPEFPFE